MKLNLAVIVSLAALAWLITPASLSAQDMPPTAEDAVARDSAEGSCSPVDQAISQHEQEEVIDLSFLTGPRDSHEVDFADGAFTTGIRFGWGVCVDSCLPCHINFPCGPGQGKCYYGGHCP